MANIRKSLGNIFTAIMRGELMLRLRVDRIFVHILYRFFIVWAMIFISLKMDQTMLRMESNRKRLEDLKIYHAQKTCELASYDRLSTVQEMLEKSGSKVNMPDKPADRIQ